METELVWHTDSHFIDLSLDKDQIRVSCMVCPFGGSKESDCYHEGIDGCIVKHFVTVYGLECNVGQAEVAARIEVAWAMTGSSWDADLVSFYFIPVEDPSFKDWFEAQSYTQE